MTKSKMTELEAEIRADALAYHSLVGWLSAAARKQEKAKMLLEKAKNRREEIYGNLHEEYNIG